MKSGIVAAEAIFDKLTAEEPKPDTGENPPKKPGGLILLLKTV